jgi:hypothetical protein
VDKRLATSDMTSGEEDDDVFPLLLIYSSAEDGRDVNLDGAPKAFATNSPRYVRDTGSIATTQLADFSANVQKAISSYYSADGKAQSLISLPIPGRAGLIGVMNLYRNSIGIMGSEGRAQNFARLMSPFTAMIGELVDAGGLDELRP